MIGFEDSKDLARLVLANNIDLFRTTRHRPGSITDIAKRLNRDKSAVGRDVKLLQYVGLLEVHVVKNPGHGVKKGVKVCDSQVFIFW